MKDNMYRLAEFLIHSLTYANKNDFKRFVISRYKAYKEYNKAWSDGGYYRIEPSDIFLIVKNHFPEKYVEYGIDKLIILL